MTTHSPRFLRSTIQLRFAAGRFGRRLGRLPAARALLAAVAVSLLASGCVVGPPPDGYYAGGFVTLAPPAPRVEFYGAPPYPGYIWMGGYWRWTGHRYDWVRGHWAAPRRGYRWVPDRWARGPRGWHQERGHWARR